MDNIHNTLDINVQLDDQINKILNKRIDKKTKTTLVLSGGSMKGIAQIGAMHCLKKNNLLNDIKTIAATSVGSIIGLLYSIGYQPIELFQFMKLIDTNKLNGMNAKNLITKYGLDDGSRMILILKKLLNAKGYDPDISFKNFYKRTKMNLIITGSCINDKKIYYFSHTSYPDMKVLEAVRISISIPIIFTPCIFEGKIFVDGGCIDNFPIQLFSDMIDNVIGIHVTETRINVHKIDFIEDYLKNTIQCLFEGLVHRETKLYNEHVVYIKCSPPTNKSENSKSENFKSENSRSENTESDYSEADIIELFDNGYVTTQNKISAGEFEF